MNYRICGDNSPDEEPFRSDNGKNSNNNDENRREAEGSARLEARNYASATHPLITWGSLQDLTNNILDLSDSDNLINISIDHLSATMSTNVADELMSWTKDYEEGFPQKGFKQSEQRMMMGGFCWRKWEPRQKSKKNHRNYESWQFPGQVSHSAFENIKRLEIEPSRIDISFDFACHEHETTSYLASKLKGLVPQWSEPYDTGKPNKKTYYLPNIGLRKYLRIYRKDIESPEYVMRYDVPYIMRFELQLRKEYAKSIWKHASNDRYPEVAAHIIQELSGIKLQHELVKPSNIKSLEVFTEAQKTFSILKQYKAWLNMCEEMGIPIYEFAKKLVARQSRWSKCKFKNRKKYIEQLGVNNLNSEIWRLINESL